MILTTAWKEIPINLSTNRPLEAVPKGDNIYSRGMGACLPLFARLGKALPLPDFREVCYHSEHSLKYWGQTFETAYPCLPRLYTAYVHMCRIFWQMWTSTGHDVFQQARIRESRKINGLLDARFHGHNGPGRFRL